MKLAKVIGNAVLSQSLDAYRGKTLLLTQDLDEKLEPTGDPEVSVAWQTAAAGELVIVEVARESAYVFGTPLPFDSAILGKVDQVYLEPPA